jgi:UDP-N-acetylglucosamine 2-epimerase (non-hydrolysing)
MQIDLVAGARPNFMKIAPLYHRLAAHPVLRPRIVHTGQHYDANMSEFFFRDLGLPEPDIALQVGGGRAGWQTGQILGAYESVLLDSPPEVVVVVGDVNSTLAATLAAVKLGIATCHLEAGLRSHDRSMPEEINRVLVDRVADVLWTPSPDAETHLLGEGVPAQRISFVGNIMIDALERVRPRFEATDAPAAHGVTPGNYGVVTLHRPENVDDPDQLARAVAALAAAGEAVPLLFPVHPRTRARLTAAGQLERLRAAPGVTLIEPAGYVAFMSLVASAAVVITDSGGLQEETTALGVPCLTLRKGTERPITIEQGSNRLITTQTLPACVDAALGRARQTLPRPEKWDGRTAERIEADLLDRFALKA